MNKKSQEVYDYIKLNSGKVTIKDVVDKFKKTDRQIVNIIKYLRATKKIDNVFTSCGLSFLFDIEGK